MIFFMVLSVVVCAPVASQLFSQSNNVFPASISSSFQLPPTGSQLAPASTFLPSQPFKFGQTNNQRPFATFRNKSPTLQKADSNDKETEGDKGHTYPDGTMAGDYPSHLAAKQKSTRTQSGQHTYPDGTMGGDYPSHLAAKKAANTRQRSGIQRGQHAYPDGTTGGNYPSHLATKQVANTQQHSSTQSGQHTYPDGTMGGDYPSHLAAKQRGTQSGQHTYPDGTVGGDYPSHLATKQRGTQAGQHTYPDGTMGGDYPSHLATKQGGTQAGQHTYPDGTTGGDYPSRMAAKQDQQQQFPITQFLVAQPDRTSFKITTNSKQPTQKPHTYPDGTTGHNYPSRKAAQEEHKYPDGTTGGDYPSRKAEKERQQQKQQSFTRDRFTGGFSNLVAPSLVRTDFNNINKSPAHGQHTYPDGTTGDDYPSRMAAKKQQHTYPDGTTGDDYPSTMAKGVQGNAGRQNPVSAGLPVSSQFRPALPKDSTPLLQFPVGTSPNTVAFSPQQFNQVYPPSSSQNQLFSPARVSANTNSRVFPGSQPPVPAQKVPLVNFPQSGSATQNSFNTFSQDLNPTAKFPDMSRPRSNNPGQHTYPDGTTGGDYPSRKAEKERGSSAGTPHVYPDGTVADGDYPSHRAAQETGSGGTSFLGSRSRLPLGQQCFQYQDLAASYGLSDADDDYPMDAIMSELQSKPYMAPMVGYESLPKAKSSSPFDSFNDDLSFSSSFSSFGFQNNPNAIKKLGNIKHFPANFDENTLGHAIKPVDKACPSKQLTLRSLKIDKNHCSVVNADYQTITYSKCLRHQCSHCGGQVRGVSACVEHYNWVSVMVYCPQWQRNQRIKSVRLYLPQGCTCNRYQC